jgi:hypothetical protein
VVRRDVDQPPLDLDVAVPDELAGRLAARREAHAVHDVVEPALERGEQVVTRDPLLVATFSNVLRNCFSEIRRCA